MESRETSLWMEMRIYQVSLGDRNRVIWVKEKVKVKRTGTLTLIVYPVHQTPSCYVGLDQDNTHLYLLDL